MHSPNKMIQQVHREKDFINTLLLVLGGISLAGLLLKANSHYLRLYLIHCGCNCNAFFLIVVMTENQ